MPLNWCPISLQSTRLMLTYQYFFLQKKAKLAILERERAEARAKEAHLEKLQEEERKTSQALQETKTLPSEVTRSRLFYLFRNINNSYYGSPVLLYRALVFQKIGRRETSLIKKCKWEYLNINTDLWEGVCRDECKHSWSCWGQQDQGRRDSSRSRTPTGDSPPSRWTSGSWQRTRGDQNGPLMLLGRY